MFALVYSVLAYLEMLSSTPELVFVRDCSRPSLLIEHNWMDVVVGIFGVLFDGWKIYRARARLLFGPSRVPRTLWLAKIGEVTKFTFYFVHNSFSLPVVGRFFSFLKTCPKILICLKAVFTFALLSVFLIFSDSPLT